MRDELRMLRRWQQSGHEIALATVISIAGSAPRPQGATLGVSGTGELVGGISGGCVEPAVVEVAMDVLQTGVARTQAYGVSDDEALAVGLTCGGTIEVFINPLRADEVNLSNLCELVTAENPVALITIVEAPQHPDAVGSNLLVGEPKGDIRSGPSPISTELAAAIESAIPRMLAGAFDGLRDIESNDPEAGPAPIARVFVRMFASRPRMLVIGAIDHSRALAQIGRILGYHVTVCDARARFVTPQRFPEADEVVAQWPHRYLAETDIDSRTVICVLTHDPKFDVPALQQALATEAGYIGVMGSRRTHEDRVERLRQAGVSEKSIQRLRSPIGLDLGGFSPAETAVAIAAEIVMLQHGGAGSPLSQGSGPIHHQQREVAQWSS